MEQLRGSNPGPAWVRFVRIYTPLLAHWAGKAGVPASDRADLLQEVFLVLVRVVPGFRYEPGRSFRAWLYTVMSNKWRDACRRKAAATLGSDANKLPEPTPIPPIDETEYRAALAARASKLIEADFNTATWQAFWRTAVEERPAAEVAAELGLSANAVYLARSRVLSRLRQELAGLWDE